MSAFVFCPVMFLPVLVVVRLGKNMAGQKEFFGEVVAMEQHAIENREHQ